MRKRITAAAHKDAADDERTLLDDLLAILQTMEGRGVTVRVEPAPTDDGRRAHAVTVGQGRRLLYSGMTKAGVGA